MGFFVSVSPEESTTIVGLILSAIYNHDSVDDIVRLLSQPSLLKAEASEAEDEQFDHQLMFEHISRYMAFVAVSIRNFDLEPSLPTLMNVGFDLWRYVFKDLNLGSTTRWVDLGGFDVIVPRQGMKRRLRMR